MGHQASLGLEKFEMSAFFTKFYVQKQSSDHYPSACEAEQACESQRT